MTIEYTCLHEQQWCVCWWLNPIQSLVKSVRHYTQKLEKRLKVITEEKKMPVFEAVHSALISSDESDEEGDVLRTRPLEGRSEEASIFFFKIWTLAIEKVCPTSKEGNGLTEGSALQVPEAKMKVLSHCSGPLDCSFFHFSMFGNRRASIHF